MATLNIFNETDTGASWTVSGLSNPFNTTYYQSIVISTGTVADGSSSPPSGILDTVSAPSSGSSTSVTDSFSTGLSPGTSTTLYAYATAASDGKYYSAGSDVANTLTQLSTPSVNSYTVKYRSIDVVVSSVSGAEQYKLEVRDENLSLVSSVTSVSTSLTASGLSVNTLYLFRVRAEDTNGSHVTSNWSSYTQVTTLASPSAPQFSSTTVGDNSISLSWSSVSYASTYDLEYRIAFSANSWTVVSTGNTTYNVTGLNNGTQYEFRVRAYVPDYGNYTGYSNLTYATPGIRPSNWSWSTAKTAGASFNLTATEWNNFTTRINQFRSYKGISSFSFTTVSTNGQLLATIYNQASDAINTLSPPTSLPTITETGTRSAASGNKVKASYLNGIRDSLNSIP